MCKNVLCLFATTDYIFPLVNEYNISACPIVIGINSFNLRMQENADGTINIPSINSDTIIICEVTLPGVPKYKVVREKAILPYSGKAEANKGLCKIDLIFPISIKLAKSLTTVIQIY